MQDANNEATASTSEALSSYSPTYSWSQGQPAKDIGDIYSEVCFLTSIQGNFRGWGEVVEVFHNRDTGRWQLTGASQKDGVAASARCIPYNYSSWFWEQEWKSAQGDVNLGNHRACLLTRVSGDFRGAGEVVRTYQDGFGNWHIAGQAGTAGGLTAGYICLDHDPARPITVSTGPTYDQAANGEHAIVYGFASGVPNEPLTGPVCFLSRMTGYFRGNGERISTYTSRSSIFHRWDWMVFAKANTQGVATSAVCIN